jgi:carbon storage regulator CsrA
MLVLTRKIGQQVVLPEQGITIDVVDVGKTRVRLGISAPSGMPIHRPEVRDRANGTGSGPPTGGNSPPDRLAADEPKNAVSAASSSAELDQCLAGWINRRTGGRISQLSVETRDDRIVICGAARSFYVRQLAQAAMQEAFDLCDRFPRRFVEYNIAIDGGEGIGSQNMRANSGQAP